MCSHFAFRVADALFTRGKKSFIFYMLIKWAFDAYNAVIHIASAHVVGVKIFAIFLAMPRFTVISLTCQPRQPRGSRQKGD